MSPLNKRYKISKIKVDTISAKWCDSNITLEFYLQNEFLGALFIEKEECQCHSCPYPHSFIKPLTNFTAYNYGEINSLRVNSGI